MKRLHPLLSTALQILHFKSFAKNYSGYEDMSETLFEELSSEVEKLLKDYDNYCEDTLKRTMGKTVKYWYIYVHLIQIYLEFSRSIRTSDFDMYRFTTIISFLCFF